MANRRIIPRDLTRQEKRVLLDAVADIIRSRENPKVVEDTQATGYTRLTIELPRLRRSLELGKWQELLNVPYAMYVVHAVLELTSEDEQLPCRHGRDPWTHGTTRYIAGLLEGWGFADRHSL